MTELLVGCPVRARDWALPTWFEHVEVAAARAGFEPDFVFVGDPERDPATWDVIDKFADYHTVYPVLVHENDMVVDRRWEFARYERMAWLRNQMLEQVRDVMPTWFLSLDSDIMLHPDAIARMIETAGTSAAFDAVGSKAYLRTRGTRYPNWAKLDPAGHLVRSDFGGVMRVDVLMAIVLMKPDAYEVDYRVHALGEDIGWGLACKEAGVLLGFDGTVTSKHVMLREGLEIIDPRVGF